MITPLRIGIAGLGTVGCALVNLLRRQAELLEQRAGRPIEISAVSARDPAKKRSIDTSDLNFVDDPLALANSSQVDAVVELIGGAEGAAKKLVEASLTHGKPVITANKALIAHHGLELAELAEKHGVLLAFEAAVAGGVPIVKTLRESLVGSQCHSINGILNGTSNYILSVMAKRKCNFDEALKEAQAKGYAEADPSFDIDGMDAAHKLAILSSIAFGITPQIHHVHTEGIRNITLVDFDYATQLGYAIKLLACATSDISGVTQGVYPCMVPLSSPLAYVDDVLNAVNVDGGAIGHVFLEGLGAGGDPTASAVIADIVDAARGVTYPPFGVKTDVLNAEKTKSEEAPRSYYLRLATNDQVGALADITRICHGHNISVDIMQQPRHTAGQPAPVVLTTHPTTDHAIQAASASMSVLPSVVTEPQLIRIMS